MNSGERSMRQSPIVEPRRNPQPLADLHPAAAGVVPAIRSQSEARSIGTQARALVARLALAAALTMMLLVTPTAARHAAAAGAGKSAAPLHLYWTNIGGVTVGRAWLDGSHVDNSFITGAAAPERVCGLAIAGKYIYWGIDVEWGSPTVGRAKLDGTGVNVSFVAGPNFGPVCGVATDGRHVYWASYVYGNIGRANLNGTAVDPSFIGGIQGLDPNLNAPCVLCAPNDIAFDSAHIYWAGLSSIGRANLDGTNVQQNFITGLDWASGVAVTSKYIYWTDQGGSILGTEPAWANRPSQIGRARLDGTHVQLGFIKGTGLEGACGLAVTDKYIYWANWGAPVNASGTTIGRANLDGTGVQPDFISGLQAPCYVAVGP